MSGYIKLTKTQEIALIGLMAAVNISSRVALQSLPNIKPVTAIIIMSAVMFGTVFGIKLSVVTTLVSNLFLGMGIYTIFQAVAWSFIAAAAGWLSGRGKKTNTLIMALFSGIMGYVFGFIVSLEKLLFMEFNGFLLYYLGGLYFDTFHAVSNLVFYLILSPLVYKLFKQLFSTQK